MYSLNIYRPELPGVAPSHEAVAAPVAFASEERALAYAAALGFYPETHLFELTAPDGATTLSPALRVCRNIALSIPASPWRYAIKQQELREKLKEREVHYEENGLRFHLAFDIVTKWQDDDLKPGFELAIANIEWNVAGKVAVSLRSVVNKKGRVTGRAFANNGWRNHNEQSAASYWQDVVAASGDMALPRSLAQLIGEKCSDLLPAFIACQDDFRAGGSHYYWQPGGSDPAFALDQPLGRAIAHNLFTRDTDRACVLGRDSLEQTIATIAGLAELPEQDRFQDGAYIDASLASLRSSHTNRRELLRSLLEEQLVCIRSSKPLPWADMDYHYSFGADYWDEPGQLTLAFLSGAPAPEQPLKACAICGSRKRAVAALQYLDRPTVLLESGWSSYGINAFIVASTSDFPAAYNEQLYRRGSAVAYEAELVRLMTELDNHGSSAGYNSGHIPKLYYNCALRFNLEFHGGRRDYPYELGRAVDSLGRLNRPEFDRGLSSHLELPPGRAAVIREHLWAVCGPLVKQAANWLNEHKSA